MMNHVFLLMVFVAVAAATFGIGQMLVGENTVRDRLARNF